MIHKNGFGQIIGYRVGIGRDLDINGGIGIFRIEGYIGIIADFKPDKNV
ncbi:MAG: hypothetical protein Q8S11_10940 [Daejeonella sp.]|nr:hypothetical protein [Daejeonella sp.]